MIALAAHDRIVAVKDAKGDLAGQFAGDRRDRSGLLRRRRRDDAAAARGRRGRRRRHVDALLAAPAPAELIRAYEAGDVDTRPRHARRSCCRSTPACSAPRASSWSRPGWRLQGRPVGSVRLPLVEPTDHQISHLRADLLAAGSARRSGDSPTGSPAGYRG